MCTWWISPTHVVDIYRAHMVIMNRGRCDEPCIHGGGVQGGWRRGSSGHGWDWEGGFGEHYACIERVGLLDAMK